MPCQVHGYFWLNVGCYTVLLSLYIMLCRFSMMPFLSTRLNQSWVAMGICITKEKSSRYRICLLTLLNGHMPLSCLACIQLWSFSSVLVFINFLIIKMRVFIVVHLQMTMFNGVGCIVYTSVRFSFPQLHHLLISICRWSWGRWNLGVCLMNWKRLLVCPKALLLLGLLICR